MLVLSRKLNEAIIIGDDIRVTLLAVEGEKVKLGIDAPHSITILREEVLAATKSANREALDAPVVSFDLTRFKKLRDSTKDELK